MKNIVTMNEFNVIVEDFNSENFESYDIMPYLRSEYHKLENKPKTFAEIKQFIIDKSMYKWWSRCEYEIILQSWPTGKHEKKIDVYWQIMLNIDLITKLFMYEIEIH